MRILPTFLFVVAIGSVGIGLACSSNSTPEGSGDSNPQPTTTAEPDPSPGSSSGDAGSKAADAGDASKDSAPQLEMDGGCLTFKGASHFCGFKSDGMICEKSVTCKTSSDVGQCKIDCEMGSTTRCYTAADVDCVNKAMAAGSCEDLAKCGWIL